MNTKSVRGGAGHKHTSPKAHVFHCPLVRAHTWMSALSLGRMANVGGNSPLGDAEKGDGLLIPLNISPSWLFLVVFIQLSFREKIEEGCPMGQVS